MIGIVYDPASFVQNDVAKNTFAGIDHVILDFFCIGTDHGNRTPAYALSFWQIN